MDTLKKRDWLISATEEPCRRGGGEIRSAQHRPGTPFGSTRGGGPSGNVHPDRSLEDQLRQLYEAGQADSKEYGELKSQLINKREELAPPRLEAVKKSLMELLDYAGQL